MRQNLYEPMTPMTARDILGLVGVSISLRKARELSPDKRKLAVDWAYASYMKANDINITVPKMPDFIEELRKSQ